MIIDSHCHLTYEPMSNALNETIDRANKEYFYSFKPNYSNIYTKSFK